MKTKLNIDAIANELRGGSAFFPDYKQEQSPVPVIDEPEAEKQQVVHPATVIPRHLDTTVPRHHDTVIPEEPIDRYEAIRRAVKQFGKEAATHRFTPLRTTPKTVHMEPRMIDELQALAAGQKEKRLATFSGIANALIRQGMSMEPGKPYGPSLEPVLEGIMNRGFARHDNRLASLQATDTYNSTKTLHIATNTLNLTLTLFELLGHKLEGDPFKRIVEESESKAIEALTKRDPRFLEMVANTHLNPQAPIEEEGKTG